MSSSSSNDDDRVPVLRDIREELIHARDLVLFAGFGFSIHCGYPSLRAAFQRIVDLKDPTSNEDQWKLVRSALSEGDLDETTELLSQVISRDELLELLYQQYSQTLELRNPWQILPHLNFGDAVTPTWDTLLPRVFRGSVEVMADSAEEIDRFFNTSKFCILRLNGVLRGDRAILSRAEYARALARNPTLSKHLVSIVMSRTHIFVGASASTIHHYFNSLPLLQHGLKRHFAFIVNSPRIARDVALLKSFNVSVFALGATDPGKDLFRYLGELYKRQPKDRFRSPLPLTPYNGFRPIRSLALRDIGPFRDLTIDFRKGTNIIVGNNGCGKSSILRAIGLGLAGDHPSLLPAADSLLRAGSRLGRIQLRVGDDEYIVELERIAGEVKIKTAQASPLQLGVAFPIGFPAFRGLAGIDPAGPGAAGSGKASVEDVLPLILGASDGRLGNIKQWLVNLEAGSERRSDVTSESAGRTRRLFESFFRIVGEFLIGLPLRFDHIEKSAQKPWRVMVKTVDGVLSFNQLAQGMNSAIALVGTVLQRLYEVYGESEAPSKEAALVIVDEIDAHMHPVWQQQILPLFRRHFPNVQIVASTHSPLVVSGMDVRGVTRLMRAQSGEIQRLDLQEDQTRGRADQLLTSPIFGLRTTLDQSSRRLLDEYRVLVGNQSRNPDEESRYQELRNDMRVWLTPPEEGEPVRRAQQFLTALLRIEAGEANPEYERKLMNKAARALMDALEQRGS